MYQVRPVLNLRPEVFLDAIKCISKLLVIHGSRVLKTPGITWKSVFDFGFDS